MGSVVMTLPIVFYKSLINQKFKITNCRLIQHSKFLQRPVKLQYIRIRWPVMVKIDLRHR